MVKKFRSICGLETVSVISVTRLKYVMQAYFSGEHSCQNHHAVNMYVTIIILIFYHFQRNSRDVLYLNLSLLIPKFPRSKHVKYKTCHPLSRLHFDPYSLWSVQIHVELKRIT